MFIWFVVLSVLGVYSVFRDPKMDYRFVAAGALLPDIVDGVVRQGAGPLHSVVVGVALLFVVVLVTIGRRPARKRWLAIPIGIFAHQILDAAWVSTRMFWWPVAGFSLKEPLPVVKHGLALGLIEELVGLVLGYLAYKKLRLANPARRRRLQTTGALPQPKA